MRNKSILNCCLHNLSFAHKMVLFSCVKVSSFLQVSSFFLDFIYVIDFMIQIAINLTLANLNPLLCSKTDEHVPNWLGFNLSVWSTSKTCKAHSGPVLNRWQDHLFFPLKSLKNDCWMGKGTNKTRWSPTLLYYDRLD